LKSVLRHLQPPPLPLLPLPAERTLPSSSPLQATLGEHAVHSLKPQLLADYVADLLTGGLALSS